MCLGDPHARMASDPLIDGDLDLAIVPRGKAIKDRTLGLVLPVPAVPEVLLGLMEIGLRGRAIKVKTLGPVQVVPEGKVMVPVLVARVDPAMARVLVARVMARVRAVRAMARVRGVPVMVRVPVVREPLLL